MELRSRVKVDGLNELLYSDMKIDGHKVNHCETGRSWKLDGLVELDGAERRVKTKWSRRVSWSHTEKSSRGYFATKQQQAQTLNQNQFKGIGLVLTLPKLITIILELKTV